MSVKENPFMLTFGKQPGRLIERYEMQDEIVTTFSAQNPVYQTYLIEGVRGSGKTVLMTAVSKMLEEDGWIVVDLNPSLNLLEDFALRLGKACERIPGFLKQGFNISAFGFGVGVQENTSREDPVGLIEDCMQRLSKKGKRVLITIDEVINDQNMRIFTSQFQIFIRKDFPLFLIMTGLYENIHNIQNDPQLTFLLRSPKLRTEALSTFQIKNQYKEIFDLDDEKAMELADITKGYAFAFQALGKVYWDFRDKYEMEKILEKLDEMLDGYIYRKVWETLTPRERDIVSSMEEGEMRVKDVLTGAGMKSDSFSKYREKLVGMGILSSPKYGYIYLTLPRLSIISKTYKK